MRNSPSPASKLSFRPASTLVSTRSPKRNAAELLSLLDARPGLALTVLVSSFFRDHNKGLFESFADDLSGHPHARIAAARSLRDAVADIAARSDLGPNDVVLRFGMHWGTNLYVGQIATAGRTEVTALGDQVNETARIEACATGGHALASKDLIEHLQSEDAAALDLNPDTITYTPLGDLGTATDKARRDAPAIAVSTV